MLDGKLTCFTGLSASLTKEMKNNGRLMKAVHLAEEAMKEDLMQRRRNYCLAARFKGVWGPAWPGCDEERRLFVGGTESESSFSEKSCDGPGTCWESAGQRF